MHHKIGNDLTSNLDVLQVSKSSVTRENHNNYCDFSDAY